MSSSGDPIPTGIQTLLSLASVDERFREQLARRRSAVAAAVGVWLTPNERAILDAIPEQLLHDLTKQMVQPPQPRRGLLRQVARTAVAALSAGLISQAAPGCGPDEPDREIGEQVERVAAAAQPESAPAAEPAPDEAVDRVRGPMVMPYGIKGPRVMPDPHMARDRQRELSGIAETVEVGVGDGVRIAAVTTKGSLSEQVVRRIAKRRLAEVRACCEREPAARPAGAGRVAVKFIVSATGAVQMAAVAESTLQHARTEECIARAVRRWLFPAPEGGGIAIATVAFDVSPKPEPAASKDEQ